MNRGRMRWRKLLARPWGKLHLANTIIIGLIKGGGGDKCNGAKFFLDRKAVDARSHVLINVFPRQKRIAAERGAGKGKAALVSPSARRPGLC